LRAHPTDVERIRGPRQFKFFEHETHFTAEYVRLRESETIARPLRSLELKIGASKGR
jgi:hypothetical protein